MHKVAGGGGPTVITPEQLEAAIKVQGKPVYFYDSDCSTLVCVFLSIYRVIASVPLSRNTILDHLSVLDPNNIKGADVKLLYSQWVISHQLLTNVDRDIITPYTLSELMLESRLAADGIVDSDILAQAIDKPFAYGKIIISKPLLATSPITNETWYFRSLSSFNNFIQEVHGFTLSRAVTSNAMDRKDINGQFLGFVLEIPLSYDKAKSAYPHLYTYHNTPFSLSVLHKTPYAKPANYRS